MKVTKLKANNYRNLNEINIDLNESCNFFVGENNLGKSNLLDLFQIIFSNRSFSEKDFTDIGEPITVELKIKLDDIEIGIFEDLFDPNSPNTINILCIQDTVDDNILFSHRETGINIPASRVRGINFIYYNSLRNPIQEVSFGKSKGVSRFLNNLIQKYLTEKDLNDKDFLHEDKISELLSFVNTNISKVKAFDDFNISAVFDKELSSLLPKLLVFEDDNNHSLTQTGYGIQFLILITLSILEKVENILTKKTINGLFETTDGKKYISLVIGLDEPEIHLHPYMQRSLIKYLNKILLNENDEFQTLIKELFDIDGFVGQLILVTHSPHILLNDYSQVIRFYKDEGNTKIISGSSFTLSEQESKHLHLLFPFIKESFFSRGVILVEGDSEYSSFPYFANKMGYDFDNLGIGLIQTRGNGGMSSTIKILENFLIPVVSIMDRDDISGASSFPMYLTDKRDFEEEIISTNIEEMYVVLKEIIINFDTQGVDRKLEKNSINKRLFTKSGNPKYSDINTEITTDLILSSCTDLDDYRYYYMTWYSINKGIMLGAVIGTFFNENNIPSAYKTVINKIIELVPND